MQAMNVQRLLLLSTVAVPLAPLLAEPGFNFRPLGPGEAAISSEVSPAWRSGVPAQPGADPQNFRFPPQQAESLATPIAPQMDSSGQPHFRYKPDEVGADQPPPLPSSVDASKDPAMQAYGTQQPAAAAGYGQSAVPGFAYPERPARPEPPPRPSYAMERPTRPEPPARPEPPPMPQPLHLEGRYIDGASRYQPQAYPFRPLDEEKPKESKTSSGTPPQNPAPVARTYQYPPMPVTPGYAPVPYDQGYNSGPSFNGFRFPFSGGNFPFNFR